MDGLVTCPLCGKTFKVALADIGKVTMCLHCGREFMVVLPTRDAGYADTFSFQCELCKSRLEATLPAVG